MFGEVYIEVFEEGRCERSRGCRVQGDGSSPRFLCCPYADPQLVGPALSNGIFLVLDHLSQSVRAERVGGTRLDHGEVVVDQPHLCHVSPGTSRP